MSIQPIAILHSPSGTISLPALYDAIAAVLSTVVVFGLLFLAMGVCEWSFHILLSSMLWEAAAANQCVRFS